MIVIKDFSHDKISELEIEDLGDDTLNEYMWGYLEEDNIAVYDKLCFWL